MADPSPLARVMAGASPQREHEFQTFMAFDPQVRAWRNAFTNVVGAPPQIEGGDYDYRAAYLAGHRPTLGPSDVVPHWGAPEGSDSPMTTAKAADHPTMWKQEFMTQFGVDPDMQAQAGFSPEMQQFMQAKIGRGF